MRFEIIKDKDKQVRKREFLNEKYPYSLEKFGRVVGYEVPALIWPFPALADFLEGSSYPRRFWGIEYYVATNNGLIDRIVPAAEYYKIAFRSLADELFLLAKSSEAIDALIEKINEAFRSSRSVVATTGYSTFRAADLVYRLKGELGNFLFVSRSLLDMTATLMHFLYGPKSKQHTSFTEFMKFSLSSNAKREEETDEAMNNYLRDNMDWYPPLKDLRDYATHYKSIDISFYEQPDGSIHTYLEDRMEIREFVGSASSGISNFFAFADEHFKDRIESSEFED